MSTDAPSPWETTVVLGDGDTAYIRPLTPEDKAELLEFHERQSQESVYRRFFSPKPTLSSQELEHFTTVDMVDRVALAVEVHDELVAWSSYERWPGRNEAEAAFMVDDQQHGRGIATLMLEHLAAIARTNGIERFTAEVLADNRGMLAVFSKAGWPLQRRFDSGVVDLDWELTTTEEFIDTVERREQRADSRAIARLLIPRAIAVVGASDRPGTVGKMLWDNVRATAGVPVYPVNPRLDDLDGRRCYGSLADVPDDAALAVVAVPTRHLESTIDACIRKRMRGAVIVTTVTARDDIDVAALVARSRRNGLRLIGPTSMGVAAFASASRLNATLADGTMPSGGAAFSIQSGSLGGALLRAARDVGLGISWFVSLGDKSDVSANDLLQFWEDDRDTKVIGLYTESLGNPRKFARIARRVSRSKPIVAVRTGAAADGASGALYQQAGVIEVPTVQALLDTCRVLESQPPLRGPNVAVVSNSSSPTTLSSAAMRNLGLEPVPSPEPLEWDADEADYDRAIRRAIHDPNVDGVLVIVAPPLPQHSPSMGPTIDAAAAASDKPVVAVQIGDGDGPVAQGASIPNFSFPEQAVATLAHSLAHGRWLALEEQAAPAPARAVDPGRATTLISDALAGDTDDVELDIATTIALLDAYGIHMAAASPASPADAVEVADRLGYPVAVKAGEREPGRSAQAGIALDLSEADDVTDAVDTMVESLGSRADHLIVQRMTPPGTNVRVRCSHDDRLGVVVGVGYGGVEADVIADVSSRMAPLSPASAAAMLVETKVGEMLAGNDVDTSPLVDVVVLAAQLCAEHRDIAELDLNPVLVSDHGATVTDARIRLRDRPDHDGPLRRLD
ncbi:MAG: GNAT family N-acetyltransferase [Ilumatobacter sp.]